MCKGRVYVHLKFIGEKDDVVYKCIPVQWDIRAITSHSEGQCLSEASELCQDRSPHFLPRGVTSLTSHWAVIQLTYWGERERASPSEVAEQNVCLYHTLCHKLLAAYIYIMH